MIVADYIFDPALYDFYPVFNTGFEYTVSDTSTENNYTHRLLVSDYAPTSMVFGSTSGSATNREQSLIEVLNMETSSLTSMERMFGSCPNLINVECDWKISNVTNCADMFFYCTSLKQANFQYWDTSSIVNLAGLFNGCSSLEYVNMANWDMSNAMYIQFMFYGCKSLKNINLANWDVNNVLSINSMFYNCENLETLNLSGWNMSKSSVLIENLFVNCNSMLTITMKHSDETTINKIIEHLPTTNKNNITLVAPGIDESLLDTSNPLLIVVTKYDLAIYKFDSSINTFPTFDDSIEYEYSDTDNNDGTITRILSTHDYVTFCNFQNCTGLLEVSFLDVAHLTSFENLFYNCTALYSIDMNDWNTSEITNMTRTFYNCESLSVLDLRSWDTNKVTNFIEMFASNNVEEIRFGQSWNTNLGMNMEGMFYKCPNLKYLDFSMWNFTSVTNMNNFIYDCPNLVRIDLNTNVEDCNKVINALPDRTSIDPGTLKAQETNLSGLNIVLANEKNWLFSIRSFVGTFPMQYILLGETPITKVIYNNLIVYDIQDYNNLVMHTI